MQRNFLASILVVVGTICWLHGFGADYVGCETWLPSSTRKFVPLGIISIFHPGDHFLHKGKLSSVTVELRTGSGDWRAGNLHYDGRFSFKESL